MAGGQSDNDKRQPLWRHGGYNRTAPLYRWTTALVAARKRMLSGTTADTIDTVTNLHSEDSYLSFERGGDSTKAALDETYAVPPEFGSDCERVAQDVGFPYIHLLHTFVRF